MAALWPNDQIGTISSLSRTVSAWHLIASVSAAYLLSKIVAEYRRTPNVIAVGYPTLKIPILSSWIAAIRFMRSPVDLVREGVAKTKNGMFRISTLQGEYVLVTTREKVAEYLKAPDSVLSMQEGANDQQQIPYTMGFGVAYRTYHTAVVRTNLTKSFTSRFDEMVEEVNLAYDEMIGNPEESTPIDLYDTIAMTIARGGNRVFVGTTLCRNKEFLTNAVDYAKAVVISAELLRIFPGWLKGILVNITPVMKHRRLAVKQLGSLVQERLSADWSADLKSKPNDLIQWLVDAAPPIERTVPQLVERIMALNVASIHTTTMTFTAALYSLAAEPSKYIPELRAELLQNLEGGKITHNTIGKLEKMESFLRESGRFNTTGLMAMQRNALKPFTFSDGTYIPIGAKLGSPSLVLHRDSSAYTNPDEFDGFRFSREAAAEGRASKSMVNTAAEYQLFGHGRHPCPGRFFAVSEMKLLFALLLLRYDVGLEPGTGPKTAYIATMSIPDTTLKVLFKTAKF